MKFASSQLAYLFRNREARANLGTLLKYVLTLLAIVALYAVLFHVIKGTVEGEQHSWITGFYWTLVVMTTLGFGDITFTSDIGRLFSIVVLLSGVVLLLVMLPFMFITLFYAPWLAARVRLRAPRELPEDVGGHVIITEFDAIAVGLVERLRTEHIPYYVIEPDPTVAARMVGEGISVGIGSDTGMSVVALERGGTLVTQLTREMTLDDGSVLLMAGQPRAASHLRRAVRGRVLTRPGHRRVEYADALRRHRHAGVHHPAVR